VYLFRFAQASTAERVLKEVPDIQIDKGPADPLLDIVKLAQGLIS
jgi:hypothetical protein